MTQRLIWISRGHAKAIRSAIEARGLTLLTVDHLAGLGDGHCSAILNGKRVPKIDTLLRILDVLGQELAFVPAKSEN